jgi:hypothetical protein
VPDRPARRQRSGRRAIDRAVAAARHFVQRAEGALSQLIADGFGRGRTHYTYNALT